MFLTMAADCGQGREDGLLTFSVVTRSPEERQSRPEESNVLPGS